MPKYIHSLTEKSKLEYSVSAMCNRLSVFEVKAKINVLVPSDVINRPKFNVNCMYFWGFYVVTFPAQSSSS